MSQAKVPYVVRVDPVKLKKAMRLKNVSLPDLVRDLIDELVESDICPCCKQKKKKKSSKLPTGIDF